MLLQPANRGTKRPTIIRRTGSVAMAALILAIPLGEAWAGERGGRGGMGGGFGRGSMGYPGRIGPIGRGGHDMGRPSMGGYWRPGHRLPIGALPGVIVVQEPYEEDEIVVVPPSRGPGGKTVVSKPRRPVARPKVEAAKPKQEAAKPKIAKAGAPPREPGKPPPPVRAAARPVAPPPAPAAENANVVPGEVLCEIGGNVPIATVDRIAAGYGLARLSFQRVPLADSALYRYRIVNRRSVDAVVRTLQADPRIASAQANHIFRLQGAATGTMAAAQYALPKLRLTEAHEQATGEAVTVAVIDSGVDERHPELAGALAGTFDVLDRTSRPHAHGTAVAGIIGARGQLVGAAPKARILAIRAFDGEKSKTGAAGTTAHVLRALALADEHGARVINLSFAGPSDPLIARVIASMSGKGAIVVAAAGNNGPKSAPSFPAADPNVIAVTATDAEDRLYPAASRGSYVTLAAPGVDILTPAPSGAYQFNSGTSMAAAYVSSLAALLLERNPTLAPADMRRILTAAARDLGPAGPDPEFGAGASDALASLAGTPVAASDPETTATIRATPVTLAKPVR